jgi:hypothetical protein
MQQLYGAPAIAQRSGDRASKISYRCGKGRPVSDSSLFYERAGGMINWALGQAWITSMIPKSNAAPGCSRSGIVPTLAIFLMAAAARSALLIVAVDVPGDGPSRAFDAYQWSQSPQWISYGIWLPGLTYAGGVASMLVPNAAIALRLLNAVVGALTASVAFACVRRIYGSRTAWIAGLAIALFPLHATLSASSLSEPLFVLWVALAEYVLVCASTSSANMTIFGGLVLGLLALAEMTRYEAWVLAPIFGAFLFFRSDRSWRSAVVVSSALVVFPLLWCVGNAVYRGDAFLGFTEVRASAVRSFGPDLASIGDSVARLARAMRDHLSAPVALMMAGGFLLDVRLLVRRKSTPPRMLHLALTMGFWLFALGLAVLRGPKLYSRYLVLGFVLSFPYVGVALDAISRGRTVQWLQVTCLLIMTTVLVARGIPVPKPQWVTRNRPRAVIELTEWLSRADQSQPILLTQMDWQSTYFLQYAPGLRWEIFSHREDDAAIRARLDSLGSSFLLITRTGDEALVKRMQKWAPSLGQLGCVHQVERFCVVELDRRNPS